jgi:hypothetical protein
MPPEMIRLCSIDLWQFRSQTAISLSPMYADMRARFEPEVPVRTEYERWAPKTRAMYVSLSPIGPGGRAASRGRALDPHVRAEEVLAVEVEERAADGRLEEGDAALVAGSGP